MNTNKEFQGFADLEDTSEWTKTDDGQAPDTAFSKNIGDIEVPMYVEDCPKCRGTGAWRPGYRCFKCKGTGKLSFKTSPNARASARKSSRKSAAKKAEENAEQFKAWVKEHGMDQWFADNATNSFAQSLYSGGLKYGHLTEGQVRAVYNAMARDADGAVKFTDWCEAYPGVLEWLTKEDGAGNEFAASLLAAGRRYGSLTSGQLNAVQRNVDECKASGDPESALDISSLKGYYAVPDGDTRLKLCVRKPGKNSRYHGWTFVDDGAAYGNRRTYGKQAPEGSYRGSVQDALRAILADPFAAQVAYGKLTGTCGTCGRILEDEASVAAGIGPICAAKFG